MAGAGGVGRGPQRRGLAGRGREYFAEHDRIDTGPDARGPALFRIEEGDGQWLVSQILDDPAGDHDWRITAELDLAATDEAGEPALTVTGFAPTS